MSVTIKIDNFSSVNQLEETSLNADVLVGDSAATLRSNQGIVANDFMLFGQLNGEASDLIKIASLTGSTGVTTLSPFRYPHSRFDKVTKLFGDQIKIYVAANVDGRQPPDSSFTALSGGVLSIDPDQGSTSFTDPAGDSSRWYKYTYLNSVTLAETNLSDSGAARGGGYATYCSVDDIRQKAGIQNNRYITDGAVASARTTAQAEIDSELNGLYVVPFTGSVNPLIADIASRLAAGFLLNDAYSGNGISGTNLDSEQKLKDARALLARIKSKELILTDATGVASAITDAGTVSGWPNSTTADLDEAYAGGDRAFRIGHRY